MSLLYFSGASNILRLIVIYIQSLQPVGLIRKLFLKSRFTLMIKQDGCEDFFASHLVSFACINLREYLCIHCV